MEYESTVYLLRSQPTGNGNLAIPANIVDEHYNIMLDRVHADSNVRFLFA
jgi:hypothetical protein